MKTLLLIYNPNSGTRKAAKNLSTVIEIFSKHGYISTCLATLKQGDAVRYAEKFSGEYDLVVAMGGDGTYNEVVSGMMKAGSKARIGYIPTGSTNDFATSMGIPKVIEDAAEVVCTGVTRAVDIGLFNDRVFTYVASFGAFTNVTYETPQPFKNVLGHLAYILSGMTSITDIRPIKVRVESEGAIYEDKYLFGAVSNSTSMGGVLRIKPDDVDMSDGKFEMLLVKVPHDLMELGEIVNAITLQQYEQSDMFIFVEGSKFNIQIDEDVDWSLDGEYQKGSSEIFIENKMHAAQLIVPKR